MHWNLNVHLIASVGFGIFFTWNSNNLLLLFFWLIDLVLIVQSLSFNREIYHTRISVGTLLFSENYFFWYIFIKSKRLLSVRSYLYRCNALIFSVQFKQFLISPNSFLVLNLYARSNEKKLKYGSEDYQG